jgi:SAM-dependent methyltransferase
MSEADRDKWEKRYREGSYQARTHPTELLAEWLPNLPRGRALDVACGAGRNALYLAEAGYAVDAIDISSVALDRLRETAQARDLEVTCIEADLESAELPDQRYDLIVMARYTNASLIPRLIGLLRDSGHFLCEVHLATDRDVIGPSDPAFRMAPNELLKLAAELRVLFYREAIVEDPDGRQSALAQLVACRGSAGF